MPITIAAANMVPARALRILSIAFLALQAQAQSIPANWNAPANTSISSGTAVDQATNAITANQGFTVNGSASVTFVAGQSITLGPSFHAIAGSAAATFHALIAPAPSVAPTT